MKFFTNYSARRQKIFFSWFLALFREGWGVSSDHPLPTSTSNIWGGRGTDPLSPPPPWPCKTEGLSGTSLWKDWLLDKMLLKTLLNWDAPKLDSQTLLKWFQVSTAFTSCAQNEGANPFDWCNRPLLVKLTHSRNAWGYQSPTPTSSSSQKVGDRKWPAMRLREADSGKHPGRDLHKSAQESARSCKWGMHKVA